MAGEDALPLRSQRVRETSVVTVDLIAALARDVQLRLGDTLAAWGDHGLRPSFGPLLELVRDGALPSGRIAAELGVSPQAASRSILTLEGLGYVDRTPSASDGRSRLVGLTDRGRQLIDASAATFVRCEEDYADLVGRAAVRRVTRALDDVRLGLGLVPRTAPMVRAGGTPSIGVIILVALHTEYEVIGAVRARGHAGVRPVHRELLSVLGPEGGRLSDAARALHVSRQAVGAMVQELEKLGYVRRRPDETDGRAVLATPTERGAGLLADVVEVLERLEARDRAVLGERRWNRLARDLGALDAAIAAAPGGRRGQSPPLRLVPGSGAAGAAGAADLERLARHLRSELGPDRTSRLAALLTRSDS